MFTKCTYVVLFLTSNTSITDIISLDKSSTITARYITLLWNKHYFTNPPYTACPWYKKGQ